MAEVLATVEPRIRRLLKEGRRPDDDDGGSAEDSEVDPWVDEAPALADLAAASVQGRVALGFAGGVSESALATSPTA